MTASSRSALGIVNSDGSGHQSLSAFNASATSPRWSPDGDVIVYVARAYSCSA